MSGDHLLGEVIGELAGWLVRVLADRSEHFINIINLKDYGRER